MTGKAAKFASWGWFGTFRWLSNARHNLLDNQMRLEKHSALTSTGHLGNVGWNEAPRPPARKPHGSGLWGSGCPSRIVPFTSILGYLANVG